MEQTRSMLRSVVAFGCASRRANSRRICPDQLLLKVGDLRDRLLAAMQVGRVLTRHHHYIFRPWICLSGVNRCATRKSGESRLPVSTLRSSNSRVITTGRHSGSARRVLVGLLRPQAALGQFGLSTKQRVNSLYSFNAVSNASRSLYSTNKVA